MTLRRLLVAAIAALAAVPALALGELPSAARAEAQMTSTTSTTSTASPTSTGPTATTVDGGGRITSPPGVSAAGANGPLTYQGGTAVAGGAVTNGQPRVYLVFWGSQWGTASTEAGTGYTLLSGDTAGVAAKLQAFYKGLGQAGEQWSGVITQYCSGVAAGATSCPLTGVPHVGYAPSTGALAGVYVDNSTAAPSAATRVQIANEAVKVAGILGKTTSAANRNVQYVVVSPSGTNPDNFVVNGAATYCGWHSWTGDAWLGNGVSTANGNIAFVNLPPMTDVGAQCGANLVNPGNAGRLDGWTIVASHEFAETVTDQFYTYTPATQTYSNGGWWDPNGLEIADACEWQNVQNVQFATGSIPVSSLWSNDDSGCVVSHAIELNTIAVVLPVGKTAAASVVNQAASLQMSATDSAGLAVTYSATGLPTGLAVNSTTGLISGTPTVPGTSTVTVTATDAIGSVGTNAFTWTVALNQVAVTNPGPQTAVVGTAATVPVQAVDLNGLAMTYAATGLPTGFAINSTTGVISGTATAALAIPAWVTVTVTDASGGKGTATFPLTVTPPTVTLTNPGPRSLVKGTAASLQLSATDSAGKALTYAASGLPTGLAISSTTGRISGTPTVATTVPAWVTVTVTDLFGGKDVEAFAVSVVANTLTVTNPGPQSGKVGVPVSLALVGTDSGGQAITWAASGLPAGLAINTTTGAITGTPTALSNNAVTITATDASGGKDVETFAWTIGVNTVTLTNPGPVNLPVNTTTSLQLNATDSGAAVMTYAATGLPTGLAISSTTGLISGKVSAASSQWVTVTVTDLFGGKDVEAFLLKMVPNTITLATPSAQSTALNATTSLQISATDSGGAAMTYAATGLPAGLSISSTTGLISGKTTTSAVYAVTVTVTDGTTAKAVASFPWTVGKTNTVTATNPGAKSLTTGAATSFTFSAKQTNNATLTYSATGLPSGLSISSTTGVISGTVTSATAAPAWATVTATDTSGGKDSESFPITVAPNTITVAPPAAQVSKPGQAASYAIVASDSGGAAMTYAASGLPSGLAISSTTGLISGKPTALANAAPVVVTVTDASGGRNIVTVPWTVAANTITAINPGPQRFATNKAASLQIAAADSGGATMTYAATGLPTGLAISSTTGLISGTPTVATAGPAWVVVTVTDPNGGKDLEAFALTVGPNTITATNPGATAFTTTRAGSLQFVAADSGGIAMTYAASGLPSGLTISSTTGLISGTVSASTATPAWVTVTVTDASGAKDVETFPVSVKPFTISLNDPGAVGAKQSVAKSVQMVAADSGGATMTYVATGLPTGMTISSTTGLISGTPTVKGTSAVVVTVTDPTGGKHVESFPLTVY